jgi:restriction endonuclease S subunit
VKVLLLGEVCTLEYGKPLDKEFRKPDGAFQAYGANGPISTASKYLIEGPCVIVGRKGSAGEITYVKQNVWPLDVTYYVKHDPKVSDLRYLFYTLKNLDIKQFVRGVKPGLNRNDVYNLPIQLPSIEKQREIVVKLETSFAEIELLERNLRLSDDRVNQLFQSLLSAAFTSLEDGLDPSNPSDNQELAMKMVSLKDLCTVFGDGDWIESKDQSDSGIRLIQTGNVGEGRFKDRIEKARWISEETFERLRCTEIGKGDVLISRLPDPVGRACILPTLEHKAITAVDCAIVRFDEKIMDPRFFVYYSQSSEYASSIAPLISGSTRQRISREKLGSIQIPNPSLEKQHEIVGKIDSALLKIDLLKTQIKMKKDLTATLRQSILSNSFSQEEAVA